ncbi:fibrillin-1-like isoform X3 [Ruditapes philippinarum]|uniref:fibrillin-1-like isoform X3 n=1 Tax=Ruditapes philippinarum TaxID=129788 RepID=UPI00295BDFB1|nr:fibrillin-1-like isoform X3 [Ruditapes philippinarum]
MICVTQALLKGIFLLTIISGAFSGFCTQSYNCERTCYQSSSYYSSCGFFGWSRCARYKSVSKTCTTCTREVCCPGYTGDDCDTPSCFNSTTCPNNGTCSAPDYCECEPGYISPNCSALCNGLTTCPNNGTCVAPDNCLCQPGFSSPDCSDIDECASNTHDCEQLCMNSLGSYQCACQPGYVLNTNGSSCDDIDECQDDNGGCEHTCTNEAGSFQCSCNDGHVLHNDSLSCNDLDECEINNGGCQQLCNNALGFYNCSCNDGYELRNDNRTCADIDECEWNNAGCEHFCRNTDGSFSCHCLGGYELHNDTASCVDINECEVENGGCDHMCDNTLGSFQCSCFGTFELKTDNTSCACPDGYVLNADNTTCVDVDECENNNGDCDQICTNKEGSFSCSCHTGYSLNSDGISCMDINECNVENGDCEQVCTNDDGAFSCSCYNGYVLHTDALSCVDVNECEVDNGGCQQQCVNTEGSYFCSCGVHFALKEDKLSCENIKEHSLSASVEISVDMDKKDIPADFSRETGVFEQIKYSLQLHFKNYTESYFKIVIRKIRKYTSLKGETNVKLMVNFTIVYEKGEKSSNTRNQILKGNLKLRHGTQFLFQGKPAQAKLHLPENVSSDCDAYLLLSGGCEKGFQCTESKIGPMCKYISSPNEKFQEKYLVYIMPVLACAIVIAVICIVVGFIKRKKVTTGNWPIKYKRHLYNVDHDEVVENVYEAEVPGEQPLSNDKNERKQENEPKKSSQKSESLGEKHQISSSCNGQESSYGST